MKRILSLVCFLFFGVPIVCAQYTYELLVIDAESRHGIAFAEMEIDGNQYQTDENGKLVLDTDRDTIAVRIGRKMYQLLSKKIFFSANKIVIALERKEIGIPEVTITAKKNKIRLSTRRYEIVDYWFQGDQLYTISYSQKRSQSRLQVMRVEDLSDTLDQIDLVGLPNKLYQDCEGRMYVLSDYQVYPFYLLEGSFLMMGSLDFHTFETKISNCIGAYNDLFFYKKEWKRDGVDVGAFRNEEKTVAVQYYSWNKRSNTTKNLEIAYNSVGEKDAEAEDKLVRYLHQQDFYHNDALMELDMAFNDFFTEECMAPFFQMEDSILIMDFTQNKYISYARDATPLTQKKMTFHEHINWSRELIQDDVTSEIYTFVFKNKKRYIAKIDLDQDKILEETEIPARFPYNFKIHDGVLYFLYKDFHAYEPYSLYKLVL